MPHEPLCYHGFLILLFFYQALKVLRTAEFSPYVVFISAPTIIGNDNTRNPPMPNGDVAVSLNSEVYRASSDILE